ncbi:MAG: ABC transporter substrate-binding protein [Chloroflexi bacterium]|nr:ABC transporter substrate-binding protein [Chloroflexota bacterium]
MPSYYAHANRNLLRNIALLFLIATIILLGACSSAATPTPTLVSKPTQPAAATPAAKPTATAAPKPAATPAAETKMQKLRIAYTSVSASQSPVWMTYEAGIFKKYGLDVEMVLIEGGTKAIPAVIAGEVPLAVIAGSGIVAAVAEGSDLVIVAGITNVMPYQLYVKPSITKPEDLKGKKVAVSKFGSSSDFATRFALRKVGLQPEKDVAILQIGDQLQRIAALQQDAVQGTLTDPPNNIMLDKAGMKKLIDLADLEQPYQHSAIATTRSFMSKSPDIVERFLSALVEGIHKGKTDAAFAKQVISKYTKSDDQEALDEGYRYFTQKLLPKVPYPTEKGIAFLIEETAASNAKAASLKPDKVMDATIVKKIESSGLIERLYKQ